MFVDVALIRERHLHLGKIAVGAVVVCGESRGELVGGSTGFKEASDVVFLGLLDLHLEAEASSLDAVKIIEDDVQGILLTADAVGLAAFTFNFDIDELLHLRVEIEQGGFFAAACVRPNTSLCDKVLVSRGP